MWRQRLDVEKLTTTHLDCRLQTRGFEPTNPELFGQMETALKWCVGLLLMMERNECMEISKKPGTA